MTEEPLFEPSYEEHKAAQKRRWAQETTVEQRLQWLEEALWFVHMAGIDLLAQKRRLNGDPWFDAESPTE